MKQGLFALLLAVSFGCSGAAFAATTPSPACNSVAAKAAQSSTPSTETSMAGTSSDMGNVGSGASSSSIATGPTDKTGVMAPCVPGTTGGSQTGAIPTSPSSAP